jgi:molybdopterin synthase catalytic subunit
MATIRLVETPLSADEALAAVSRTDCGGTALFLGTVRSPDEGRAVSKLAYTAHRQMVEAELGRIAAEAEGRWPGGALYVAHRLGELAPGEISVVVAASCPHRAEAFSACRWVIDELKKRAPIWKEEFSDEGKRWIPNCSH